MILKIIKADFMSNIYIQEKISGTVGYQSFFTDAEEINQLMVSLMGDVSGAKVLEPCAGQGAFVKPLIQNVNRIDAIDIDQNHIRELQTIKAKSLTAQEGDFIDYFVSGPIISTLSLDGDYDAIICNPPYGLKFSVPYRKKIKSQYPELYARESYGLFVVFGIRSLRQDGRFVFIVPDTFLTSRNHRPLRKFLVSETNLTHLVQFDSSRFETVNFGYGSLCILAGNRDSKGQSKPVRWLDFRKKEDLLTLSAFDKGSAVVAKQLIDASDDAWTQSAHSSLTFSCKTMLLGEMAECRTGIYTGDNPRFCGYDELSPPSRINGHPISWDQVTCANRLSKEQREKGIVQSPHYVPFIRGGHRAPFESTRSALDWSLKAVNYYRLDKKARLQNSKFYFKKGLAVPMVTSGRLSASYIEGAVFDQGVVGIFPHEEGMIYFLLVFLNSRYATDLKGKISPSANNSANYLKRFRIPIPTERHLEEAFNICESWKNTKDLGKSQVIQDSTAFLENFLPTQIVAKV